MDISVDLLDRLGAICNPYRLQIVALLASEKLHVSGLARRLQMSRALLYIHLKRLEDVGFLDSHYEVSETGKSLRYFSVVPFSLTVDVPSISAYVNQNHPLQYNTSEE